MAELVEWAKADSGNRLGLTGFTDGTGNPETNARLAEARAQSVQNLLIDGGVPADQIELIAPQQIEAAPGQAWQARRVDVVPQ